VNIILVVFDSLRKDSMGCYGPPPWWEVKTPHFDALAKESLVMDRMYPEALPTLPTRRALYTGKRVYPFVNGNFHLKGDFVGAPGWGPIPEDQDTIAELLRDNGYRTGLVADVYHMFKPSKNYWRGFNQWMFLRGQETDPYRSGPALTQEQIDYWLPKELQNPGRINFIKQCIMNMHDRVKEEDYLNSRVLIESARWLEQNKDADKFFLTIESFDPHEPWLVPEYYRRMYDDTDGPEQVISGYADTKTLRPELLRRTQANYAGLVTMCDRWFGHLYETMRTLGMLDNTALVFTTDHGHSIGDFDYMGKRGYPSTPEVYDVPLIIRHPEGIGAGKRSDMLVQHIDVSAQILEFAGVQPKQQMDGKTFWKSAIEDGEPIRDHVTVGWGSAMTVIDHNWWLNCKVNGKGAFLRDLKSEKPFENNVADKQPDVVKDLYKKGVEDAGGEFPDYIMKSAEGQADAPGCSELVPRI
jgi:arylsulfatase A-like enzyme